MPTLGHLSTSTPVTFRLPIWRLLTSCPAPAFLLRAAKFTLFSSKAVYSQASTSWRAPLACPAQARARCDVWPILPGSELPPEGWPGWPDGKKFAFVLTHDVESQQGLDRVKQLAELEMELGFRSSFNFTPEGPYSVPGELRSWLTDRGFEVGVHDLHHDGHLFSSREGFRRKAERINAYLKEWNAVGFRSGYMLRNLDWIHDLNITYDACTFDTDPFEPQPDGVSTIFPFWVPAPASELPAPGSSPTLRRVRRSAWSAGQSTLNPQRSAKRIRRASLHAPSGFDALPAPRGKHERHLEEETGLDRRAQGNGAARHTSGLYVF